MNDISFKNSFKNWYTKIPNNELDIVIDYVLTNHNTASVPNDCKYWLKLLNNNNNENFTILDFGCGVCRNTIPLAKQQHHWKIIGYDNIHMLQRAEDFCIAKYGHDIKKIPNLILSDDWNSIKSINFDCVMAWLVFQHIDEEYISQYLYDIKTISKKLIISSRQFNDQISKDGTHKDTFTIIENILGKPEQFILDNNSKYIHGLFIYNFHTSI